MARDLVLLRYTDQSGKRLAALCRPREGVGVLRDVLGEGSEKDGEWFASQQDSAVVIATSGSVVVRSAEDLDMLAMWFSVAAKWLRAHGG